MMIDGNKWLPVQKNRIEMKITFFYKSTYLKVSVLNYFYISVLFQNTINKCNALKQISLCLPVFQNCKREVSEKMELCQ